MEAILRKLLGRRGKRGYNERSARESLGSFDSSRVGHPGADGRRSMSVVSAGASRSGGACSQAGGAIVRGPIRWPAHAVACHFLRDGRAQLVPRGSRRDGEALSHASTTAGRKAARLRGPGRYGRAHRGSVFRRGRAAGDAREEGVTTTATTSSRTATGGAAAAQESLRERQRNTGFCPFRDDWQARSGRRQQSQPIRVQAYYRCGLVATGPPRWSTLLGCLCR